MTENRKEVVVVYDQIATDLVGGNLHYLTRCLGEVQTISDALARRGVDEMSLEVTGANEHVHELGVKTFNEGIILSLGERSMLFMDGQVHMQKDGEWTVVDANDPDNSPALTEALRLAFLAARKVS